MAAIHSEVRSVINTNSEVISKQVFLELLKTNEKGTRIPFIFTNIHEALIFLRMYEIKGNNFIVEKPFHPFGSISFIDADLDLYFESKKKILVAKNNLAMFEILETYTKFLHHFWSEVFDRETTNSIKKILIENLPTIELTKEQVLKAVDNIYK